MNIRLSCFSLGQFDTTAKQVVPGDKVCPANGVSSIGVIQNISKQNMNNYSCYNYSCSGKEYTILWLTGNKKGKISKHSGFNLVSIKHYLDRCQKEIDDINAKLSQANQFGL